jgi:hypothetical protein
MNKLMTGGAILIMLGVIGFSVPYFTTRDTKEVARLGDLKIQATEEKRHAVPPEAAAGIIILGALVFGAGFVKRV